MKFNGHVYLTGFSGSGKTTVGRRLATRLKCRFVDSDEEVARAAGMTVPELFRQRGEAAFRKLEAAAVLSLARRRGPIVIALGGGALGSAEVRRQALAGDEVTVYLSCAVSELYRRLRDDFDRPLLEVQPGAGETLKAAKLRKIQTLLQQRVAHYREAGITVSTTNRKPDEAVREIIRRMMKVWSV